MPRKSEVGAAFMAAIELNPKGYKCLRTTDFVRELRARNWPFNNSDANAWIRRYQPDFVDKTEGEGDNRYWILRNMGRVH
ncbi:hypothetical protein ABHD38_25085 [Enterobacter cloacae]|uniref:hypothetical protein n=1 Tax=Enterobacter cloacae TaxID=550 RepID=UPI00325AFCE0